MRVQIIAPAPLIARVASAAAASPDHEICGLLFGDDQRIAEARATRNVAHDPATAFEIDPAALLAALRAQRAGGARLIGHYHSHPRGPAEPSARDLAASEPGPLWLIAGAGEIRAWRAADGCFHAVALLIEC